MSWCVCVQKQVMHSGMNTEDLDGFTHAATVFESGQVVLYCYLVCLWPLHRSLQLRKKK